MAVCGCVFWASSWFVMSGAMDAVNRKIERAYLGTTANWGFAVQNILVDGRVETDLDTFRAMMAVDRGDAILGVNPSDIKASLEKLSWIKKASVERRLPDTLYVKIEERKPIALWQKNKKLVLIDGDGVVLTDQNLARWKNLLIVVGDDAPQKTRELIAMLSAEPSIKDRVEAATLISGRRWDLMLKSGAEVKLPEKDLGLALRNLAVNHEQDSILDRELLSIDVREDGRITLRAKPGGAQGLSSNITPASGSPI